MDCAIALVGQTFAVAQAKCFRFRLPASASKDEMKKIAEEAFDQALMFAEKLSRNVD